jgi:hypothetical protein
MFTSETDPYSFKKTNDYSFEVISNPHSVPYFVQPKHYTRNYKTRQKQQKLDNVVEAEVI